MEPVKYKTAHCAIQVNQSKGPRHASQLSPNRCNRHLQPVLPRNGRRLEYDSMSPK